MTVAAVVIVVGAVALWAMTNPRMQPLEPDAPLAIGLRVDDGELLVWSGARCLDVERAIVRFTVTEPRSTEELRLEADVPATLDGPFGVRGLQENPPRPFEVTEVLPEDLDIAEYDIVSVTGPGNGGGRLEPVLGGSAQHPGEFWFGDDLGWMSLEEAADRDGDDFYSLCATDVNYS